MHECDLIPHDMLAILASFVRSKLLTKHKAHYLFAGTQELNAQTPMDAIHLGMSSEELMEVAGNFTTMFDLPSRTPSLLLSLPTLGAWALTGYAMWEKSPETIVFSTSGSTGTPTTCRQPFTLLKQEIQAQARIFQGCSRILTLVPRHHIYGFLFSVLLPKTLNIPVYDLPPVPSPSMLATLTKNDLVVAFPLFWKSLAKMDHPIPDDIRGVTSTGPCPPEIIHTLLNNGLKQMTEVYGSSETGGLGARSHPDDAYTLLPFWQPHPEEEQDPTQVTRVLPDGSRTSPYDMPDLVHWDTTRTFRPIGRKDKAVQVAGVNVYPEKIAAIIQTHPDVHACTVRLMRPDEGTRLKAFIVSGIKSWDDAQHKAFRTWLAEHLSSAEIPKALTWGETLPVNAMGKVTDWDFRGTKSDS